MKKFTIALAAVSLGIASMGATPVKTGALTDLRVTGTTEAFRQWQRNVSEKNMIGSQEGQTRSWSSSLYTYEADFQISNERLCDMLTFDDGQGNAIHPTFDKLPYYCMYITIWRQKNDATQPNTMISFVAAWPTVYIYDQVFGYKGELDEDGLIPVEDRNYDAVSIDELFNNENRCRRFQESEGVGTAGTGAGGMWEYYSLLPNAKLGITCQVDGLDSEHTCYTVLSEQEGVASYLDCLQFDPDDSWGQFICKVYYNVDGSVSGSRQLTIGTKTKPYNGEIEVQGFYDREISMPKFGDLHIFNTGVISSDILGDENPFPADLPEVSALFFAIGDEHMGWTIDDATTAAVPFDRSKFITTGLEMPPSTPDLRDYCNYIDGYLFADPKYGKDINLDLEPTDFIMQPITQVDLGDIWYYESAPTINSMIQINVQDMNGNMEPWSADYGTCLTYRNLPLSTISPSFIGWGYNEGILINFENYFLTTYTTTSTGKIYYHYNPKNMRDVRELNPIGGKDGVKEVVAEGAATIKAANGVITVAAAQDSDVAVYGLDGVCLKSAKVAAGQSVNVEAAKGIYVVKVGDKAQKVAL